MKDSKAKPEEKVTAEDIGAQLSEAEQEKATEEAAPDAPKAVEPQMFDLTKLSPEMLQGLKAALDNVPSGIIKPTKKNATVELHEMDGKPVVNFGRAFLKLLMDPESRSEKLRQHIGVTFLGEEKETVVLYQDFMSSPRITCEVISQRTEPKEKVVGECFSREKKVRVPMMVTWNEITLTIKLPSGKTIEISSEKVNQ